VSQAGQINSAAGPVPPTVPTSFVTDNGTAIPAANILNVNGGSGIVTSANPNLSNNLLISIQNSSTDTTVTSDILGQTRTLTTIVATNPGSYLVEARISAFEPATQLSAGFSLFALINSTGGVATVETDTDKIAHVMSGLKPPVTATEVDVNVLGSGGNIIIQVVGIVGKTIDWGGFTAYVYRG
jgi:hypothetical protein